MGPVVPFLFLVSHRQQHCTALHPWFWAGRDESGSESARRSLLIRVPPLYQQDTARAGKTWIGKYHNRYSPVTPIEEFEYFGFVLQIIQSNGNIKQVNNKRLFYRVQLLCRRPGVRPCAWRTYCPAAGPRACGQSRLRAIRCPAGIMKNSWGRGQDWGATDWTEQESTARVSVDARSILIVRSADNR